MKSISKLTPKVSVVAMFAIASALLSSAVFAADVSSIATTAITQMNAIAKLLSVASYVAGVGFAMAGILQFKAHKEAPTQTPLSKPVVMLLVAACLLFLPTILSVAGSSLFGSGTSAATAGGGTGLSGS
jgi:intracellular multiplication protein IcmD